MSELHQPAEPPIGHLPLGVLGVGTAGGVEVTRLARLLDLIAQRRIAFIG